MTLENRRLHRQDIILYYYEEFIRYLQMMGYKKAPPTLLDLNVELTRCGPLAAQMSICYMPYLFAEWHLVDSNAMFAVNDDTENFKRSLYLNPEFKEFIEEEFEDFFMKGFI